jgi:hypothetical protein
MLFLSMSDAAPKLLGLTLAPDFAVTTKTTWRSSSGSLYKRNAEFTKRLSMCCLSYYDTNDIFMHPRKLKDCTGWHHLYIAFWILSLDL